MDKYKHFHPFRPFLEKKSENVFKKLLKLDSVCAMLRQQNEGTQRRALPNAGAGAGAGFRSGDRRKGVTNE